MAFMKHCMIDPMLKELTLFLSLVYSIQVVLLYLLSPHPADTNGAASPSHHLPSLLLPPLLVLLLSIPWQPSLGPKSHLSNEQANEGCATCSAISPSLVPRKRVTVFHGTLPYKHRLDQSSNVIDKNSRENLNYIYWHFLVLEESNPTLNHLRRLLYVIDIKYRLIPSFLIPNTLRKKMSVQYLHYITSQFQQLDSIL